MASDESDLVLKDRVSRLMQFLQQIVKARTSAVLDVERHESVQWLYPKFGAFDVDRGAAAGDVLVRAPKVHLEAPPTVPKSLHDWTDRTDLTRSDSAGPRFIERRPDDEQPQHLVDKARSAFERWQLTWNAWAETDRVRRPAYELYQSLSASMEELKMRPESVELVVATGLLTLPSQVTGTTRVNTHLISQEVLVERDDDTGDLVVRLVEMSAPRLEDGQLLTGMEIFDESGTIALQKKLGESLSPLDESVLVFLKDWVSRALSVPLEVEDVLEAPLQATREASLRLSPALILRRRGAFALAEYYNQMINHAATEGSQTPLGLAQLVTAIEPAERVRWLEATGATAPAQLADDPLFPLPANAEQAKIIDRLGGDSGVVVEGPPGTGKTHTIANLVSALLAQGQRVLVTSEKSQALQVLRDKLPPDMQELCVSITDLARGGSQELNRSVATIAGRKTSFVPEVSQRLIDDLSDKRRQARAKRSTILEAIRSLRESEFYQHPEIAPGYSGTLATIVRALGETEAQLDWLPGPLYTPNPPLDPSSFAKLIGLLRALTPEHKSRATQAFPPLNDILLPPDRIASLFEEALQDGPRVDDQAAEILAIIKDVDTATSEQIRDRCQALGGAVEEVRALPAELAQLADRVLSGSIGHLWDRMSMVDDLLDAALGADREIGVSQVEAPQVSRGTLKTIDAWLGRLEAGAEWRGRFRRTDEQKAYDALELALTVDGDQVSTSESLRVASTHLHAMDAIASARQILADLGVTTPDIASRTAQVNALRYVRTQLTLIDQLLEARTNVQVLVEHRTARRLRIGSVDEAATIASVAAAVSVAIRRTKAQRQLSEHVTSLHRVFSEGGSPESSALITAIESADLEAFNAAIGGYQFAARQQHEFHTVETLLGELKTSSPMFAAELLQAADDPHWDVRADQIARAWHWRLASDWVAEQRQPGREARLSEELDAATSDIATYTARLAAEKAWKSCLARMTATEVTALQTYREHVHSVGKGTGRYAERYRQAARQAMQEAQSAVPAWVMPTQQVLASIPPTPGVFDVVIVDEASQVDITSLFLLWLAPRVIVVGDDKQCTPSEVAMGTLESVFARLDSLLPDLPDHVRTSFTPRSSLFSLLRSRFGQVVRLREHFRSMPEIISWSSNQFYRDSPLVPVRQFGADRLPPLRATYVPGATVDGKDASLVNVAEAEAIANQVAVCLSDPAYDAKTMGVVVLQGQGQVNMIMNKLRGRVSEEDWEERRFRVGTPPDFQGDERDVIFLSMVVAPEQSFRARTNTQDAQRFNVGASRAKDQMWLFHSVTVDRLSSSDFRRSLLEHVTSTAPALAEPIPENVSRHVRDNRFDSLFEQRVFNDIVARGYHVNPQIEVNNRRIDLVVTGGASRLAVECDGDAFHSTPEQIRADLERETELRRCGWTFWRVRESEYYLDPIEAMSGLWSELDRLGIKPLGASSISSVAQTEPITAIATDPDDGQSAPGLHQYGQTGPAGQDHESTSLNPPFDGSSVETSLPTTTSGEIDESSRTPEDGWGSGVLPPPTLVTPPPTLRVVEPKLRNDDQSTSNWAEGESVVETPVLVSRPSDPKTKPNDQPAEMSDEDILSVVRYNSERGRIEVDQLADDLCVPYQRVEAAIETLVAAGELEWKLSDAEGSTSSTTENPPANVQQVDTPPATATSAPRTTPHPETIKQVLLAAAWSQLPLTVDRASRITKQSETEALAFLDQLVNQKQLIRERRHGADVWMHAQGEA
ncbi:AAA domain-containing protein [Gordonia sp. GN26]